jgi:hypothetical protein
MTNSEFKQKFTETSRKSTNLLKLSQSIVDFKQATQSDTESLVVEYNKSIKAQKELSSLYEKSRSMGFSEVERNNFEASLESFKDQLKSIEGKIKAAKINVKNITKKQSGNKQQKMKAI